MTALPANGQVLFREDFETSSTNIDGTISLWDGPPNPLVMYLSDRMAHSGRRALELKYLPGSAGSSFMYKPIPGQDRVYLRWYQRWAAGFQWEESSTKMVIFRPHGGYPQFYPEVLWANGQLAIQAQVVAEANWDSKNFYQNQGEPIVFQTDRWYCVEVLVGLNTPGAADGELAAWIDGELKLQYTGREFRGSRPEDPAPSTAQIQAIGLSGYFGGLTPVPHLQFTWQDDVVASTQPIGHQILSDDFEANATDAYGGIELWDGPGNPSVMALGDRVARSGARALELTYNPGSRGASYMYKHFAGQERLYVRWYQRWSSGFAWEPSSTGLIGLGSFSGYPHFYPVVLNGTGQLAIQAQVIAEQNWGSRNFFQNRGAPLTFEPERWYCIEVFVKLNTPGLADGALAAWIDGVEKLNYSDRRFRGLLPIEPAPATARLRALLVAGHYGGQSTVPQLQFSWHDDYVASTERIGCQSYAPILH